MEECVTSDPLDAVACPTCQSRVIKTREGILFCQPCCVGYPLHGEVPDFRSHNVVDFKKLIRQSKGSGAVANIQLLGTALKKSDKTVDLKTNQCLLVGRAMFLEPNSDITFVGVPQESRVSIGPQTRQLIDQYLLQGKNGEASSVPPLHPNQYLGSFERCDDVLVDDKSVSRAHAVFYHMPDGLWVLDLVSKNGTYVGGREIEHAKLKHNDVVTLGCVNFRILLR